MPDQYAAVLDEIEEYLEQREDVRDGSDGPLPNKAMSLLQDLRAARSQTGWIPVGHRLPDDDITVMIAMKDGDEPVWLGYYDGDCWYSVDATPIRTRVTHWRPMPEGPTKEDRRATGIR